MKSDIFFENSLIWKIRNYDAPSAHAGSQILFNEEVWTIPKRYCKQVLA